MATQSALDAADYLVFCLSHQFEGAIYGMSFDSDPIGQGFGRDGDPTVLSRSKVTIMLNGDFEQTASMYKAACDIVHTIYRQHGIMIGFALHKEGVHDGSFSE